MEAGIAPVAFFRYEHMHVSDIDKSATTYLNTDVDSLKMPEGNLPRLISLCLPRCLPRFFTFTKAQRIRVI